MGRGGMTPEERDAKSRQHPMWPVFEAYYAGRRRIHDSQALTAGTTVSGMALPTDPRDDQAHIPQQAGGEPTGFIIAEQRAPAPKRWRRWWIAAAAVGVLAAAGGGTAYALMPSVEDEAVAHCQSAIRDKLFSPSTAVFAEEVRQDNSTAVFRLSGELDAQNKLGGTIRGEYFCVLRHEDDGSWVTTEARVISR